MAVCATATSAALTAIANANSSSNKLRPYQTLKPITSSMSNPVNPPSPHLQSLDDTTRKTAAAAGRRKIVEMGLIGVMAASTMALGFPLQADATRIEYYATTAEPTCEYNVVGSGLAYCDLVVGSGDPAPYNTLINVHYTARFGDEIVFDSTYKRGRPLIMRIGVGKVIKGLDQGIFGGNGVPPMHIGGKRKLRIPPELAYGPEPAGCFSGDCNIPANASLLYDINFVGLYSGNRSLLDK